MCYVFSLSFTAHTNSHTLELVHYVPKRSMLKYSQSSWMVYCFPVYILSADLCTNADITHTVTHLERVEFSDTKTLIKLYLHNLI